jgi:hypothetical protein
VRGNIRGSRMVWLYDMVVGVSNDICCNFCGGSRMIFLCRYLFFCRNFLEFLRPPHNQITNVNFLLKLEVSGGLHRAGCYSGLQFVEICVECVWRTVFTFSPEEFGRTKVFISER